MLRRSPTIRRLAAVAAVAAVGVGLTACVPSGSASSAAPVKPGPSTTGTFGSAGPLALSSLPGHLLWVSDSDNYGSSGVQTMGVAHLDGSGRRSLRSTSSATWGMLAASPSGSKVAWFSLSQSAAKVEVMSVATGRVSSPFKLAGSSAYIAGLGWTSDGGSLLVASNVVPGTSKTKAESAIFRVPLSGGSPVRLTPYEDAGSPVMTPDGQHLVFVRSHTFQQTSGFASSSLWVSDANGSSPHQILSSGRFIAGPAVSPDGSTVAFSITTSTSTSHLASVPVAGGPETTVTPAVPGRSDILPAWAPNGAAIAFLSSRAGRRAGSKANQLLDAYVVTPTGAEVTPVLTFTGNQASMDLLTWGR